MADVILDSRRLKNHWGARRRIKKAPGRLIAGALATLGITWGLVEMATGSVIMRHSGIMAAEIGRFGVQCGSWSPGPA